MLINYARTISDSTVYSLLYSFDKLKLLLNRDICFGRLLGSHLINMWLTTDVTIKKLQGVPNKKLQAQYTFTLYIYEHWYTPNSTKHISSNLIWYNSVLISQQSLIILRLYNFHELPKMKFYYTCHDSKICMYLRMDNLIWVIYGVWLWFRDRFRNKQVSRQLIHAKLQSPQN